MTNSSTQKPKSIKLKMNPEEKFYFGIGTYALIFIGLIAAWSSYSDYTKYRAYLQAQKAVIDCRSTNPKTADQTCGDVPKWEIWDR